MLFSPILLVVAAVAASPVFARRADDPGSVVVQITSSPASSRLALGGNWGRQSADWRGIVFRPDVQAELGLNGPQKNSLAAPFRPNSARQAAQQERLQQEMARFHEEYDAYVAEAGRIRELPASEQKAARAVLDERRDARIAADKTRRETEQEQQSATQTQQMRSVLTPEQERRLAELVLQFRGPLALADPQVADQVGLSAPVRAAIQDVLAQASGETSRAISGALLARMRNFSARRQAGLPVSPASDSPKSAETARIRAEAERAVIALLPSDEKARWEQAQGKTFSFEVDR